MQDMRRFSKLAAFGVLTAALTSLCIRPISAQTTLPLDKQERASASLDPAQESTIDHKIALSDPVAKYLLHRRKGVL